MNKPNFFVVGTAKAGTTMLYNYLASSNEVFVSPIKEPNYFNTELKLKNCRSDISSKIFINFDKYFSKHQLEKRHNACIDDFKNYIRLFEGADKKKIICDFSTSYLSSVNAYKEIYKFNPSSKILIILRNPIERTLSHYVMDKKDNIATKNILYDLKSDYFSDVKGYYKSNMYLELSLYYKDVKKYLDLFPKEQILVIFYEDLISNRKSTLEKLCNFLGLENSSIHFDFNKLYNNSTAYKSVIFKIISNFFKKLLPSKDFRIYRFLKSIMKKNAAKPKFDLETQAFINSIVKDDFIKTKKLIEKVYKNQNN